jgi:hypothetical protein
MDNTQQPYVTFAKNIVAIQFLYLAANTKPTSLKTYINSFYFNYLNYFPEIIFKERTIVL